MRFRPFRITRLRPPTAACSPFGRSLAGISSGRDRIRGKTDILTDTFMFFITSINMSKKITKKKKKYVGAEIFSGPHKTFHRAELFDWLIQNRYWDNSTRNVTGLFTSKFCPDIFSHYLCFELYFSYVVTYFGPFYFDHAYFRHAHFNSNWLILPTLVTLARADVGDRLVLTLNKVTSKRGFSSLCRWKLFFRGNVQSYN